MKLLGKECKQREIQKFRGNKDDKHLLRKRQELQKTVHKTKNLS